MGPVLLVSGDSKLLIACIFDEEEGGKGGGKEEGEEQGNRRRLMRVLIYKSETRSPPNEKSCLVYLLVWPISYKRGNIRTFFGHGGGGPG